MWMLVLISIHDLFICDGMAKTDTHLRLDPALRDGLSRLSKKLAPIQSVAPNRTQLIELAIRELLKRHGIKVSEEAQR